MRIVHYLPDLELVRGGIVRAVIDLATAQAAQSIDTIVIVRAAPDVPTEWADPASTPRLIRMPRSMPLGWFSSRQLVEAKKLLAGADALHLHNVFNPELVQLARVAQRMGVRVVVTPHGTFDPWSLSQSRAKKAIYSRTLLRSVLRRASVVHFTAEAEREHGERMLLRVCGSLPETVVIPYLIDLTDFEALSTSAAHVRGSAAPVLLFLSRIHPKKGIDDLLASVHELVSAGSRLTVKIAGSGEDRYVAELEKRVHVLGLDGVVEFTGALVGADRLAAYAEADLFVLPTHQENFGIVLIEALAAGVPAVTTDGTDIWRELRETGGAVVIPRPSRTSIVPALTDALSSLLGDADRRRKMGVAGAEGVLRWLDRDGLLSRYRMLYDGTSGSSLAGERRLRS